MLKHFLDLMRANYRMIFACALVAGLAAMTLSILLLKGRPLYEASVSVTMEPSEEELRFNRSFMGVSQFNPATIIVQSHIERLMSRPVAERAIDILTADMGGQIPSKGPSIFSGVMTNIWKGWNTLNYGYSIPLSDRDQMVADLQNAITVEIVEGSYILNISITYDDPVIAAAAANALAKAYVEEAQDRFGRDAAEIAVTIAEAEKDALERMAVRRAERFALSAELGVADPVAERMILLQAREDARVALRATETKQSAEESRLDALQQSLALQPNAEIARSIRDVLAAGQAGLQQLRERQRQDERNITEIERSLAMLDSAQAQLAEIDEPIAAINADLQQLQERRAALELSKRARLSQIMIINPATPPLYPTFPKVAVNTIVALIAGGIIALVPVFTRDALGSRVRTTLDVGQIGGARSLPSLTKRRVRRQKPLRPADVDTLVRRIAADRGGWADRALMVTGFLPEAMIAKLTRSFDGAKGSDGQALHATSMPPLTAIGDWSPLHGQAVVVAMPSGEVERSELESLQKTAEREGIEAYYLVIL